MGKYFKTLWEARVVGYFVCFLIFGFDKNLEAQETKANVDVELHQIKLSTTERTTLYIRCINR